MAGCRCGGGGLGVRLKPCLVAQLGLLALPCAVYAPTCADFPGNAGTEVTGPVISAGPFTEQRCQGMGADRGGGARMTVRPDLETLVCMDSSVCTVRECCLEKGDEEHHTSLAVACTGLCFAFVAAVCLSDALERAELSDVAPSSTCMILMGIALGIVGLQDEHARAYMEFNPELFGFFLLPVIIFSSSYNMGAGAMHVFFVQFGRISFFAVFGTLVAILFTGTVLLGFDRLIGFLPEDVFPPTCSASTTAATEEECLAVVSPAKFTVQFHIHLYILIIYNVIGTHRLLGMPPRPSGSQQTR